MPGKDAERGYPLTPEALAGMDGLPVWAELAGGRNGYGLVAVEEFGAMIYIRMLHEHVLAFNHGAPNHLLDPKIYKILP